MTNSKQFILAFLVCTSATSSATAQVDGQQPSNEIIALEKQINDVVRESGELESAVTVELRSPFNSIIEFLVPDGTKVEKGELLVQLDLSAIEKAIQQQQAKVTAAKADLAFAEQNLAERENAVRSGQSIGERRINIAKMRFDLFRGVDGEYQTLQRDLADQLIVLESQSAYLEKALAEIKSQQQGENKTAAIQKAETDALEAEKALATLKRQQRLEEQKQLVQMAEFELSLMEQEMQLAGSISQLKAEKTQAQAKLDASQVTEQIEQANLQALSEKRRRASLHSPQDGVVLHPVPGRGAKMLDVGAMVQERQTILKVADLNKLQVAVTVNETRIGRVQLGQQATIQFDAWPQKRFRGTVTSIKDTPEPTSFIANSGRKYRVTVSVEEPDPQLRIGMTAMVDIRRDSQ